MRRLYLALLAAAALVHGGNLTLSVDPRTGAYAFGGSIALVGGPTSLRANGQLLSTADGSLALDGAPAPLQGTDDTFGSFTGYQMSYNNQLLVVRIKEFPGQLFLFEQFYPRGVNGTAAHPGGNATEDSYALSSAFPAFVLPPAPWAAPAAQDLAAACFSGGWLDPLPDWPMITQAWRFNNESTDLAAALGFMASALAIYNGELDVLALSPLDNFFTTQAAIGALQAPLGPGLALGVGASARVEALPAGFTSRTIVLGGSGINDTVFALGSALLAVAGKPRLGVVEVEDIGTKYISLWTDNGSFLYYHPEANLTYQQTMIDAVASLKAQGVPVQTLQFDVRGA
jgi:hypothetical protein